LTCPAGVPRREVLRRGAARALLAAALLALARGTAAAGPPPAPLVYVAIGASSTEGWGATPRSSGYVFLLADRIRSARGAVALRNLGVKGARIEGLLARQLPVAAAVSPGVVTVWEVANDLMAGDSPEGFEAQLESLLRQLRERTAAPIFVGDLLDLTKAPHLRRHPSRAVTPDRITAFNASVRTAVEAAGAFLVPLSALPLDDGFFAADGLHPGNAGHALVADAFWREIALRLPGEGGTRPGIP
jgi:lysophospholipase L1-like esterase